MDENNVYNFSANTMSTHISPNESNPRGACHLNAFPTYFPQMPQMGHTRAHSHIDNSKCSIPRHSNISQNKSGLGTQENILMKKLIMKRNIQSYFMSSRE